MIGVYFSGTGNTKYCLEKFVALYDGTSKIVSLEEKSVIEKIMLHKDIVFAYPIYYSNLPKYRFIKLGTNRTSYVVFSCSISNLVAKYIGHNKN